jgi:DNA-binding MarR family transcriptional regulator
LGPSHAEPLPAAAALLPHKWYVLNRAAQRLREMVEEALTPFELRRRHYATLGTLSIEGSMSQQALSARIPIDRATMVQIIDDLERLGMVERQPEPSDRRAYQVALTAHGRAILVEADRQVSLAEAAGLKPLSNAERKLLDELSRRLCGWV